jgi:hypothetical protein
MSTIEHTCEECGRTTPRQLRRKRCNKCYLQLLRQLPPEERQHRPQYVTVRESLVAHRRINENGCWIWAGAVLPTGYVQMTWRGRTSLIHRASYSEFVGPIPAGLQIDHLCRVRNCFNPEHLEPVTAQENILRSPIALATKWAARTHCEHGHEFTPENIQWQRRRDRPSKGYRRCRTCERLRKQARRRAARVARGAVSA